MDEQTKNKPKINKATLVPILLLLFFAAIYVAIALPGFVSFRPEKYCYLVIEDATNIKAAISDYFSDPAHTDLNIRPGVLADTELINNPWTLTVCGDNIFIHVADSSGKCPAEYQARYPELWHSGVYTEKFLD